MSKTLIDKIPVANWIIYLGSVATAITAFAGAWAVLNLPTPVMEPSATLETIQTDIEEIREESDDEAVESISRFMRQDRRELYDVEQRLEGDPANDALIQQKLDIEEALKDLEARKERRRKRKDGG